MHENIHPYVSEPSSSTVRQSLGCLERLLKVSNDVVNVLRTNRDADSVLLDTGVTAFLLGELLMGGGPRVDSQSLGVADTAVC